MSQTPPERRDQLEESSRNGYIFDPERMEELTRLLNLDQLTTRAMGGPLSGLSAFFEPSTVLDLACGPGGWVLDVAFALPQAEVAGVDISRSMISYADARARVQRLRNASFGVMDISKPLDFSAGSFDLINARFLVAVLGRAAWKPFLEQCWHLLRPGGYLRLTEPRDLGELSSPACMRWRALFIQLLWQEGYQCSPGGSTLGIVEVLAVLLQEVGFEQVVQASFCLDVSREAEAWAVYYHNEVIAMHLSLPLLRRAGLLSQDEGEQLLSAIQREMHHPDFVGSWNFCCLCARKL